MLQDSSDQTGRTEQWVLHMKRFRRSTRVFPQTHHNKGKYNNSRVKGELEKFKLGS